MTVQTNMFIGLFMLVFHTSNFDLRNSYFCISLTLKERRNYRRNIYFSNIVYTVLLAARHPCLFIRKTVIHTYQNCTRSGRYE